MASPTSSGSIPSPTSYAAAMSAAKLFAREYALVPLAGCIIVAKTSLLFGLVGDAHVRGHRMMHGDNARPQFGPFQVISASDLPTPTRSANCVAAGMCIVAAFVAVMLRFMVSHGDVGRAHVSTCIAVLYLVSAVSFGLTGAGLGVGITCFNRAELAVPLARVIRFALWQPGLRACKKHLSMLATIGIEKTTKTAVGSTDADAAAIDPSQSHQAWHGIGSSARRQHRDSSSSSSGPVSPASALQRIVLDDRTVFVHIPDVFSALLLGLCFNSIRLFAWKLPVKLQFDLFAAKAALWLLIMAVLFVLKLRVVVSRWLGPLLERRRSGRDGAAVAGSVHRGHTISPETESEIAQLLPPPEVAVGVAAAINSATSEDTTRVTATVLDKSGGSSGRSVVTASAASPAAMLRLLQGNSDPSLSSSNRSIGGGKTVTKRDAQVAKSSLQPHVRSTVVAKRDIMRSAELVQSLILLCAVGCDVAMWLCTGGATTAGSRRFASGAVTNGDGTVGWNCAAYLHAAATLLWACHFIAGPMAEICYKMMALGEHQAMVEQLALLTRTVGIEREANAAKKQFLRYVFHEMRVPFNSLVLGLESVSMCPSVQCNEESREDVGMMQGAAQAMTSVMNNVLRISAVEGGGQVLRVGPASVVDDVLRSVHSSMAPLAEQSRTQLIFNVDPAMPRTALFDAHAIQQVLSNLLTNAFKFSNDDGSAIVDVMAILVAVDREPSRGLRQLKLMVLGPGRPSSRDLSILSSNTPTPGGGKHRTGGGGSRYGDAGPRIRDATGLPDDADISIEELLEQEEQLLPISPGDLEKDGFIADERQSSAVDGDSINGHSNVDVSDDVDGQCSQGTGEEPELEDTGYGRIATSAGGDAGGSPVPGALQLDDSIGSTGTIAEAQRQWKQLQHQFKDKVAGVATIRIVVADNGCGMAPGEAAKLFVPFQQIQSGDNAKSITGTGLSLAICKEMVQRHGGRIWAQSELRVGSTFTFELPLPFLIDERPLPQLHRRTRIHSHGHRHAAAHQTTAEVASDGAQQPPSSGAHDVSAPCSPPRDDSDASGACCRDAVAGHAGGAGSDLTANSELTRSSVLAGGHPRAGGATMSTPFRAAGPLAADSAASDTGVSGSSSSSAVATTGGTTSGCTSSMFPTPLSSDPNLVPSPLCPLPQQHQQQRISAPSDVCAVDAEHQNSGPAAVSPERDATSAVSDAAPSSQVEDHREQQLDSDAYYNDTGTDGAPLLRAFEESASSSGARDAAASAHAAICDSDRDHQPQPETTSLFASTVWRWLGRDDGKAAADDDRETGGAVRRRADDLSLQLRDIGAPDADFRAPSATSVPYSRFDAGASSPSSDTTLYAEADAAAPLSIAAGTGTRTAVACGGGEGHEGRVSGAPLQPRRLMRWDADGHPEYHQQLLWPLSPVPSRAATL